MRKARKILLIALPALAVLEVLAVSSYAGKPGPAPVPTPTLVEVTGGIYGQGEPQAISPTFVDRSRTTLYPGRSPCSFVSHPGSLPSLTLSGAGMNSKVLTYFYCTSSDHPPGVSICGNQDHEAAGYYCRLQFGGGIAQKKSAAGEVLFPVGSPWRLTLEATGEVVQGTLAGEAAMYRTSE